MLNNACWLKPAKALSFSWDSGPVECPVMSNPPPCRFSSPTSSGSRKRGCPVHAEGPPEKRHCPDPAITMISSDEDDQFDDLNGTGPRATLSESDDESERDAKPGSDPSSPSTRCPAENSKEGEGTGLGRDDAKRTIPYLRKGHFIRQEINNMSKKNEKETKNNKVWGGGGGGGVKYPKWWCHNIDKSVPNKQYAECLRGKQSKFTPTRKTRRSCHVYWVMLDERLQWSVNIWRKRGRTTTKSWQKMKSKEREEIKQAPRVMFWILFETTEVTEGSRAGQITKFSSDYVLKKWRETIWKVEPETTY